MFLSIRSRCIHHGVRHVQLRRRGDDNTQLKAVVGGLFVLQSIDGNGECCCWSETVGSGLVWSVAVWNLGVEF